MRRRAMKEDHSWDHAAREYARLYLAAYARRRGHPFSDVAPAERDGAAHPDRRDAPRASTVGVSDARRVTKIVSIPALPSDRLPPLPARLGRAAAVQMRS